MLKRDFQLPPSPSLCIRNNGCANPPISGQLLCCAPALQGNRAQSSSVTGDVRPHRLPVKHGVDTWERTALLHWSLGCVFSVPPPPKCYAKMVQILQHEKVSSVCASFWCPLWRREPLFRHTWSGDPGSAHRELPCLPFWPACCPTFPCTGWNFSFALSSCSPMSR